MIPMNRCPYHGMVKHESIEVCSICLEENSEKSSITMNGTADYKATLINYINTDLSHMSLKEVGKVNKWIRRNIIANTQDTNDDKPLSENHIEGITPDGRKVYGSKVIGQLGERLHKNVMNQKTSQTSNHIKQR